MNNSTAAQGRVQEFCPVSRFQCLFTHDIRRKAKRWQDGYLRYHSFNRRVMVYDASGYLIGDTHWRHDVALQDGDELELDKGVIVQVGEFLERKEADISQLLQRKETRNQLSSPKQIITIGQSLPRVNNRGKPTGKPRSLNEILGIDRISPKRPIIKRRSSYGLRQESLAAKSTAETTSVVREAKKGKPGHHASAVPSVQISSLNSAYRAHLSMDKENGSGLTPATKEGKEELSPRPPFESPGHKGPSKSIQNDTVSRSSSVSYHARTDHRPRDEIKRNLNKTPPANAYPEKQRNVARDSTHAMSQITLAGKRKIRARSPPQAEEPGFAHVQDSPKRESSKRRVLLTGPNSQGNDRARNDSKQSPRTPHTSRSVSRSNSSITRSGSTNYSDNQPMTTLHMAPEKRRKKLMFMDFLSTAKKSPPNPTSRNTNERRTNGDIKALGGFQSANSLKSSRVALRYPPEAIAVQCSGDPNQSIHQFFGPTVKSEDRTTLNQNNDINTVVKDEPSEVDIRNSRLAEIPEHSVTVPPVGGRQEESNLPDAVSGTPTPADNDSSVRPSADHKACDGTVSRNNRSAANRIKIEASDELAMNRTSSLSQRSPARYFDELRSRSIAAKD